MLSLLSIIMYVVVNIGRSTALGRKAARCKVKFQVISVIYHPRFTPGELTVECTSLLSAYPIYFFVEYFTFYLWSCYRFGRN